MDSIYRYDFFIFGIVQGVAMRYFIKNLADKNKIVGWTSNQADGSVKVVAEGTKEVLNCFHEKLKIGNTIARVDNISLNISLVNKYSFNCFEIEP